MRIAVVIPAYQEAATLRGIVQRTLAHCRDVYVIDDGSTDGTAETVADLPVHLVRHARNQGKAASLWDGFEAALAADADLVITLDADGQHRPEDIPRMTAAAQRHPGRLVIGARLRERIAAPPLRRMGNALADFGVSWAAGHPIVDSQSGQRAYPAGLLRALMGDDGLRHGTSAAFTFESELLIEAVRRGCGIVAVPIATVYAADARPSHFRPLRDVARIVGMLARRLAVTRFSPRDMWRAVSGTPAIEAEGPSQGARSTMPAASEHRS